MFLLKKNPLRTSFDPSGSQSGNQGRVNFIVADETNDERKTQIHNSDFLISPTTHLFPLSGQSRSREVCIKITLKSQIWNMKLIIKQSILPCRLELR